MVAEVRDDSETGNDPIQRRAFCAPKVSVRSDPFVERNSSRSGLIALAILAALITVIYEVTSINERAALKADIAASALTPIQFSLDPLSFLLPVPDVKFVDAAERSGALTAFKGRLVLLNVWATWCPPCREEMPSLDRLQSKFDPSKFIVLPLSIDRSGIPAVRKFYAELGLHSIGIYVDQAGSALFELGLRGIPATLLIDENGAEIGRKLGPAEWDGVGFVALLRDHLARRPNGTQGGSP
jgi:thiol-disulfide isomerase/thioredoxin